MWAKPFPFPRRTTLPTGAGGQGALMGPHSPVCVLVGLLWKAVGADGISRGSAAVAPLLLGPYGPRPGCLGAPWPRQGAWGEMALSVVGLTRAP